ncbi:uncharacterized protein LOC117104872 isoform X2 [Anneissia japonica]|uniref:uncharacterized protein LOC117104872 isoform X2 n=1 Tax=Anneissia japonica TaxID=1529436 RepID=UPI001425B01E|nr:uncharacterized protein LOC117104872 isoform X2 [Anneissia japonica]
MTQTSTGQLTDPNKQVFPIITNAGASPTKSFDPNEKTFFELPKINERTAKNYEPKENNALIPSLPRVPSNLKNTLSPKGHSGDQFALSKKNQVITHMPYQVQNFRSCSKIKMVPLSKRNRDMFTGLRSANVVVKQKQVPLHGQRFLWEEGVKESKDSTEKCISSKSFPEKFVDWEEQLEKFRSEKRKLEPYHRKKRDELQIGGATAVISERDNYNSDMQKLRHLPLPAHSQELLTGKGIHLPPTHTSHRKREQWEARLDSECKATYSAPPIQMQPVVAIRQASNLSEQAPSAISSSEEQKKHHQPAVKVRRKSNTPKNKANSKPRDTSDTKLVRKEKSNFQVKEKVSKEKEEGTFKKNTAEYQEANETALEKPVEFEMFPEADQHMETNERTQDDNDPAPLNDEQDRPDSEMDIEYTSSDQDMSKLCPPRSSIEMKSVSPNPLKMTDLSLYISDARKQELIEQFKKLDSNSDGHITFKELKTAMPKTLTKYQERFVKELTSVYEIVSSSTYFGLEEFITVTCLCENISKLSGSLKDAFEDIHTSTLEKSITQFVMLFATVDRQQNGSISKDSLKEILSMALDKDIASIPFETILKTMDQSGTIDKVEFLSYIPYFLKFK